MDPEILFLDNHLFVVNKPAGWSTQTHKPTLPSLEEWGKNWLKNHFHKPGNVFLEPVHRIDTAVSGIVLCARTSKALLRLQQAQRQGFFQKKYYATVEGELSLDEGVLEHYLVHGSHKAEIVSKLSGNAKHCLLTYRVLERKEGRTRVEIDLKTGRYHQIRAQFSAIGHPILGDQKYGSTHFLKNICLQHGELQAPHPITQEKLIWHIKSI